MRWVVVGSVLAVAATACHSADYLSYAWDDRKVLCSIPVDDLSQSAPWDLVEDELAQAAYDDRVSLLHAHGPTSTISIGAIERIISLAEEHHLAWITHRELEPGPARAGLALAFDDNAVEEWLGIRDLLTSHHARVTFFVSRYALLTDAERAGIDQLARDGHDIQPHSVLHLHPEAYAAAHGVDGYMTDEFQPSFDAMQGAGYPPTVFAYPFGERSDALDAAILQQVGRVRVSPGHCPY